ncbi:MAG: hypothetical protein ACRCTZ_15285 [Sarcina sp.]
MKKVITTIIVFMTVILFIGSFLAINKEATEAFNSSKYERNNIDYEEIKEDIGLDLENLSKDESFIKTYDTKDGFIVVFGDYKINLSETVIGSVFLKFMDTITLGIDNFKDFVYDLVC